MLKCREIVGDADRLLAGNLSRPRKIAVRMHLMMCRHCRRYVRYLRALLAAIPFMHGPASDEEVSRVMDHINDHGGETGDFRS